MGATVRNYKVGEAKNKRARARARESKSKRAINQATQKSERRSEAIIRRYLRQSTRVGAWQREGTRAGITRARLHDNMRVRQHESTRARKRERMLVWGGLTRALRALVGGLERESMRPWEHESMRAWEYEGMRVWEYESMRVWE